MFSVCLNAHAADIQWSGADSFDWNDSGNWVGGVVPSAGDNAHLDVAGGSTSINSIDDPNFNSTIQQLYVGETSTGVTLNQSSGTLTLSGAQAWVKIGAQGSSSGTYNLSGSAALTLNNDVLAVGEDGVGNFRLSNSAQASAPRVAVGRYADGQGTVTQSGSTALVISGTGSDNGGPAYGLEIGGQSTALSSYSLIAGTLSVTGGNVIVAGGSGSNGLLTQVGGAANFSHELHVGEAGAGTLNLRGGQLTSAGQFIVGNTNGGAGTVTQTGGTLALSGGANLLVGAGLGASGSYQLQNGTLSASGRVIIGEDGFGTFTQSGGVANLAMDLSVGDHSGTATAANPDRYTISGGTLSATGALQVGWNGYAVMSQSGGAVTTSTDLHFGGGAGGGQQYGQGIYNLSGGTLTTPSIFVSSAGSANHQFNFTGGTLRVGAYNSSGVTTMLGPLTQTSSSTASLLDVTTQNTTLGGGYSISGTSSQATIDNGRSLHVAGVMSVNGGATVTLTSNAGNQLIVDGSAANPNNSLNVGVSGGGQLAIGGGAVQIVTGDMFVGQNSGASGIVTQNGGAVTLHASSPNWLYLGNSAGSQGAYVLNAGALSETNKEVIGFAGLGTFTQNGGANTAGAVVIGSQGGGFGTYNLASGTLTAGTVSGGGGNSTFNFNGGTLSPSANSTTFMQGLTNAVVRTGGAKIDTAGFNVTVNQRLLHDTSLGANMDGGLLKLGAGTLTLGGASTFNGGTTISAGTLQLGDGANFTGALTGPINDATALIINNPSPQNAANVISGAGTFTKLGPGTLTLNAQSTFSGGATISGGAVQLGMSTIVSGGSLVSGPLGIGSISLNPGAALQDDGAPRTLANNITLNGAVTLGSLPSGLLTFDPSGLSTNVTLAGNPTLTVNNTTTINNSIVGSSQSLTKAGNGTLVLGGANSYSGPTAVNSGSLLVNGSLPAASSVSVNSGGKLGGTGSVSGAVSVAAGGQLAAGPASGIGTLSLGSVGLVTGSVLDFTLGSPGSGAPSVGGFASRDAVAAALTLPTGGGVIVNLTDNAGAGGLGSLGNGTYKLLTYGSLIGGAPTFTNTFTIGAAPAGKLYTFTNTGATSGEIDLVVVPLPAPKLWNGNVSGAWDTTSLNWQGPNNFNTGDFVTLDDSAAGPNFAITVAGGGVQPGSLAVSSSGRNYSLGGGGIGGAGALVKSGFSTLTLSSANTFGGGATVNAGTLRATNSSGSATGAGPVTVSSSGLLAGSGTIAGATIIGSGGALAPSAGSGSASTLTLSSSLTLNGGAQLDYRLNQPNQTGGAGGNDFVSAAGPLTIGPAGSVYVTPGANFAPGTYHLLGYGSATGAANLSAWSVGLQGTPASLGSRNYAVTNNAGAKTVDLVVSQPTANLLLRYSFHDYNSTANATVADTSGNQFVGTPLKNTSAADVATATGPDNLPAIHLTKDDNLSNVNGGTATSGSGITTSTLTNPPLNNPGTPPTTQTLNITNGPFTASAWVKLDTISATSGYQMIFGTGPNAVGDGSGSLHLGFRNNTPYFGFWGNDSGGTAVVPAAIQNGWFHITFRYNPTGGQQDIFLNGGDGATAGDAATFSASGGHAAYGQTRTLLIGRMIGGQNGTVGAFGGSLADVRVYGSALTNQQVALLAAPAGTLYDWNSSSATDWNGATWNTSYATKGPAGLGIADVAEFGVAATIAGGTTVNTGGVQQVARLITANANPWTLSPGSGATTSASPLITRQISQQGAGALTISSPIMIDDTNLLSFDGTTTGNVTVTGPIYNTSGALTKSGTSNLSLAGANTYGGPTTVTGGVLQLAAPTVITSGVIYSSPIGTGPLSLGPGATLQDDGGARLIANSVAITGVVTFSSAASGSLTIDSAGLTTPTSVTLSNSPTLIVSNTTTINSVISGFGQNLPKAGSGTLVIGGVDTYTGATLVNAGTLRTTPTGRIGTGALQVSAANGVTSSVVIGGAQTVSSVSGTQTGTGVISLSVSSGGSLTVNQASTTTFAGPLINSGAFSKSNTGTLEFDAPPTLNSGSVTQLQAGGGTLRLNSTSGAATIGAGATVIVATGATLQLAGTVSNLSSATARAGITNNSQAAAGGILVTGADQQVGGIDGSGSLIIAPGGALTADHIVQNSLTLQGTQGSPSILVLAPSSVTGSPLVTGSSGSSGSLTSWLAQRTTLLSSAPSLSSPPTSIAATGTLQSIASGAVAIPEPATATLLAGAALAAVILLASSGAVRRTNRIAR